MNVFIKPDKFCLIEFDQIYTVHSMHYYIKIYIIHILLIIVLL
jgi:hypothetical protein